MAQTSSTVKRENLRAGGVAQIVELLSSKYEALSSNPTTEKKKKKEEL
jgi:sigma54-dependent transcription regulator